MIIRSFFRRITTKIYIVLLSTIIIVVGLLNSFNISLKSEINEIYHNTSLFIISSKIDAYGKLKNDKRVDNVRTALEFKQPSDFDEMVEDDYNKNHPISWTLLSYYSPSSMLVYKEDGNDLSDNEILLGLDSLTYENSSNIVENYKGKKVTIKYNEKEYNFEIKDLFDAGMFSEFRISKSMYEKLQKEQTKTICTSKIIDQNSEKNVIKDYNEFEKNEDDKIGVANFFNNNELSSYEILEQYKSELKDLKKATYVLYFVFLIMFIIISKNILEDLYDDIRLERLLGYTKKNVKNNILKRILSMYAINIIISIIVSTLILILLNYFNDTDLIIFNYKYYALITLFLIISNSLLILFANNKINMKRRR